MSAGFMTRGAASPDRPSGTSTVARMASTPRTSLRRRPRGTANTVQLGVHVDLDVKQLLDNMAAAAGVNNWEVVTVALLEIAKTTNADGVPAALASSAQPSLVDTTYSDQEVTAA